MKNGRDIEMSQSVLMALEAIRQALPLTKVNGVTLRGLWMQMNMTLDQWWDRKNGARHILFSILIHPRISVSVTCYIHCIDGVWTSGSGTITLPDYTEYKDKRWEFTFVISDGQITVQMQ